MSAFVLLVSPNALGAPRMGFTVSRKVGNAVARNRARRRLREAARIAIGEAPLAADHVWIARPMPDEQPFSELVRDARRAVGTARARLGPGGA